MKSDNMTQSNAQEVDAILAFLQQAEDVTLPEEPAPADLTQEEPAPAPQPERPVEKASIQTASVPAGEEDLPPAPTRRNPFRVLWESFRENLPSWEDSPATWTRKVAFLLALAVLIGSLGYILFDLCVVPWMNARLNQSIQEVYQPENSQIMEDTGNYPNRMLASFRGLYDLNPDVRGWLSYHAQGNQDFLNIEYPVVHSGDNDAYLRRDFFGDKNKNGTLFFDENNILESPKDRNRNLIIYGHNMASGQMFAGMNKLIGNVNNARVSSRLTLTTLYEKNDYLVFAVVMTDEQETGDWYFSTRRTRFSGADDFLRFVEQLRARSLFDYPVDVTAQDELLVLTTCTAKSTSKLADGRLMVIARKMREGETGMATDQIQKNEDVIMPRNWYINQDLPLHVYYGAQNLMTDTTETAPAGTTDTTIPSAVGDTTADSTADTTTSTTTQIEEGTP